MIGIGPVWLGAVAAAGSAVSDPTGPIGDNPPTAYDKTFTVSSLDSPATLLLTAPTTPEGYDNLLADAPSVGAGVSFSLHPLEYVTPPQTVNVAFTVPLPFGLVTNVNQVRIMQGATEIPTTVEALGYWRDGASQQFPRGAYVRSVLVRANINFPDSNPLSLTASFGQPRTNEAGLTFALSTVRHTIDTSSFFPSEYAAGEAIWEPNAVAVFSTDWLCSCVFKTRPAPFDAADAQWAGLEGAYQNLGYTYPTNGGGTYAGDTESLPRVEWFMRSMVNDVRPHVETEDLINYESAYAPWLYDRAMTLWLAYIRTGKLKWWRHAHRATQFYKNHINPSTGYFDLRADDVKYSYGQSMMVDYWMTGDESLIAQVEAAALPSLVDSGNYTAAYTYVEYTGSNSIPGWTERHAAYALLAQLNAWELTGTASYLTRAQAIFDALYDLQQNPGTYKVGWVKDGGLPHTIMAHEGGTGGGTGNDPVTSPWMSGLLLDSVLRYYLLTEDPEALTFMADFGDFYANVSLYVASGGEIDGFHVPWYLASNAGGGFTYTDSGQTGDMEHVPDVLGAMAKCLWAKDQLGQDKTALQTAFTNLYALINGPNWLSFELDGITGYWIRTAQATIDLGQTFFRLAPPRKGSWWFNSPSDLTYLEKAVNG